MKEYFEILYKEDANNFYQYLEKVIKNNEKKMIVTANSETFIMANDNDDMKKILYDSNSIVIPDGISLVKGAKILGVDVKERIPGVEVVDCLLSTVNKYNDKTIYLYGSKQDILVDLEKYINDKYPNVKILGLKNGYTNNEKEVFDDIFLKKPDIIFIALGVPKQEKLIYKYFDKFDKGIFIGVGGSFDTLSGHKKRAPKLFIKLNIEWLYRILKEPKRIKRFFKYNIKFILIIFQSRRIK